MLEIIRFATKNLGRRRTRTILTTLAVIIAIAFTVGLLSISEGFIYSFEETVKKRGADIYVTPKGETFHLLGMGGSTFSQGYVEEIAKYENVRIAVPVFVTSIPLGGQQAGGVLRAIPISVRGYPPSKLQEFAPYAEAEKGRLLEDDDEYALVVGSSVAQSANFTVGDVVKIKNTDFTVVGVLKPMGSYLDTFIMAPIEPLQRLYGKEGNVSYALIQVNDISRARDTARAIEENFSNLSALTAEDVLNQMNELVGMARAMHISIASVSLLIGTLFIFSTMSMAVSERVREIGTLKAIGASRGYIFKMIISESVMISLVGGIIGLFFGYILSKAIGILLLSYMGMRYFETAVSTRIIVSAIVIAFCIGGFAGLYPAWRASKQNIVEALRYE